MRFFHLLFIALFFLPADTMAGTEKPSVRFGLLADIQYADVDAAGNRYYRNSLEKLDECVESLNSEKVAFTINLGDAIDRDFADFDPVMTRLERLEDRVFSTTGNHDYSGNEADDRIFDKLGMPSEYYSFYKKGWVFIMLNTNEISEYSCGHTTYRERQLATMYDTIRSHGGHQAASYNGGIGNMQFKWLHSELARAENSGKKVLIFTHHPLWPESGFTALNNTEILDMLDNYRCVKAVFCGHHHVGDFAYFGNIPVITVEGMIETETENSFGIVELYDDRIVIKGTGRMSSRILK